MIDRYSLPEMQQIWSEKNKYDKWLATELAVCEAWTEEGTIPPEDMKILRHANYDQTILEQVFIRTRHDVTAFLESVTTSLGRSGRWLHLGLTSSDVIDTAFSLQLKESSAILLKDIDILINTLRSRSLEFKYTPLIGRTHGMHAEPTTFGLKLANWWDEMRRNKERLIYARDTVAVGKISGAVGTHATVPISVESKACKQLGLMPVALSTQILQRDRHAHFMQTLAIIAASLEKFATEIRHLQRTEIAEVAESFGKGQTGSSAMPHKRNPELSERICGLSRLLRGFTVTALENVALWHERDISHSSAERIIFPDACLVLDYMIDLFNRIIRDLQVFPKRMQVNLESTRGLVFSQRVLLALIDKGLSREDAYTKVQENAMKSWDTGTEFLELLKGDPEISARIGLEELSIIFDYSYYIRYVDTLFERAGLV